jgi:hypothetical protein
MDISFRALMCLNKWPTQTIGNSSSQRMAVWVADTTSIRDLYKDLITELIHLIRLPTTEDLTSISLKINLVFKMRIWKHIQLYLAEAIRLSLKGTYNKTHNIFQDINSILANTTEVITHRAFLATKHSTVKASPLKFNSQGHHRNNNTLLTGPHSITTPTI